LLQLPAGEWLPGGFLFIGRTAFVFALALAYDLCDLQHDRRHGLATLVQQLGPRRSFRAIDMALILAAGCAFANYTIGFFGVGTLAAIWTSFFIAAWAVRVVPVRAEWGVWRKTAVDGLMILQATLVVLSVK
jgi:4-hydroxybenzoate polyprenyltransferase